MQCVGNRSSSASQRLLSADSIEIRAGIDERLLIRSHILDDKVLSKSAHTFNVIGRLADAFRLDVPSPKAFEAGAKYLLARGYR